MARYGYGQPRDVVFSSAGGNYLWAGYIAELIGALEKIRERLVEYEEAGIQEILLCFVEGA
jgi:hypothetical protein